MLSNSPQIVPNQKTLRSNNTTLSASPNSALGLFTTSSQRANSQLGTPLPCPNCEKMTVLYTDLRSVLVEQVQRISNLEKALSDKNIEIEQLKAQSSLKLTAQRTSEDMPSQRLQN